MSDFVISAEDKIVIASIIDNLEELKLKEGSDVLIITFHKLYTFLTKDEVLIIKRFLTIQPRKYGFNGEWLGIVEVPTDLVMLSNQQYVKDGKGKTLPTQFIPQNVHKSYMELNKVLIGELGGNFVS